MGVRDDLTPARKYKQKATEKKTTTMKLTSELTFDLMVGIEEVGIDRVGVWGKTKAQLCCLMITGVIGDK